MAQNGEDIEKASGRNEPNGIETTPVRDEANKKRDGASAAYGYRIDALVLSGTHQNPRRLVNGRNKAFLEIGGRPLVRHVVDALVGAEEIDRIFVVGPADELREVLAACPRTECVQQEGKVLSNSWAGIRASEQRFADLPKEEVNQRPVLVLSLIHI